MERETSEYKIRAVSPAQLRVLTAAGGFENKGECLTRTMDDGRLEIVMLRTKLERFEELYAECAELDEPSAPELPELPVAPPSPSPNIPQADIDRWKQSFPDVVPDRGPSERPRDGGTSLGTSGIGGLSGRIDIGGIFDR